MNQVTLAKALRRLHRLSGEPSTREIARRTHGALSHTTVGQTLRGDQIPSWRSVELIVNALGGDSEEFRGMWVAARDEQDGRSKSVVEVRKNTSNFARPSGEFTPNSLAALNKGRLIAQSQGKEAAISFLEQWQNGRTLSASVVQELARLVGRDEIAAGRYKNLIESAISDDYPDSPEAAMWLSFKCDERKDRERSLFFMMAALRMDPNNAHILYSIGIHYDDEHDLERASFFLRRALEIKPDPNYLYGIVNALCMLGLAREAAQICQNVYRRTRNSDAVDGWVKSLMAAGAVDDAVRVLKDHSESVPSDRWFTLLELGNILCQAGRTGEARSFYKEALSEDASEYVTNQALAGLAYIDLTEGRHEEADISLSALLKN
ncbi:tetratricopeptide repeat protein [Streptomyces bikiniensis]|uniref:Tetratricopeptide repeat protein n=1 Tax=Streptomyces bikiniensis TaxID=1896 RepID=A0ABW8D096_STRBI